MSGKKNTERILNLFKSFKGILPYLGVASVLLILTFAIFAIYNYISSGLSKETMTYNWEYSYSDSPDVPMDEDNTRLFGAQTAIVTDKDVVRNYARFEKTFDATETEEPFTLIILTDHSPVRVFVNGEEEYNNLYSEASYVGNCYNDVTIEGNGKAVNVRVDMSLPFSVRFEPHIAEQHDSVYRIVPMAYVAAAFIGLSILSLIAAGIASIIKKRFSILFPASLYLVITGICIAVNVLPEMTYYLINAPVFFRIFNAVKYACMFSVAVLIAANSLRKLIPTLCAGIASVVTIGIMILIANKGFFIYEYITGGVLLSASVVISAKQLYEKVKTRIQLAPTCFVICIYLIMCSLLTVWFDAERLSLGAYIPVVAIIVTSAVFIYVKHTNIQVGQATKALLDLSARHSRSVANVASILHDMMGCGDEKRFLADTSDRIYNLLSQIDSSNSECKYSVAIKEQDDFAEVKNSGISGCDYRSITRHCELRRLSYVYSGSYFALTFSNDKSVHAIIYFEGISNVLDDFFISILLALYSGLDLIYQNIIGQSMKAAETSIFVQLAKNVDIATGTPGEHIERVSKYVYAVCRAMNLDDITSKSYALASKFHDIGKLAIPHSIIAKPGRFSDSERFIMKGHTDYGAIILSSYQGKPIFKLAAAIALYHHEQYDGKGYHGISGEAIPLCARITALCDTFDALTTKRDYKDKWSFDNAVAYISENSGTVYDAKVVEAFMNTLPVIKRISRSKEEN